MPSPNLTFTTRLVSTLADLGLRHVCISPGSRNTPLIAAFAAEDRVEKWTILDERSAGFFAIGLAKTTGLPVALTCTSGTAAVEYHPAVVEASQTDLPLIALTADRPPELRGIGAPQTVDQINLYGSSTRLFIDAPLPDDDGGAAPAELALAAWAAATGTTPGPVHLNLPFREPLLTGDALPSPDRTPHPGRQPTEAPDVSRASEMVTGRRGLIVAGRSNDPDSPSAIADLARATGFPIVADPLSGLRYGTHSLDHVLGSADALIAAGALDRLVPDVVIRFGPIPTSKSTWTWMQQHPEIDQILVDTARRDATSSARVILTAGERDTAAALVATAPETAPAGWTASWTEFDLKATETIGDAVAEAEFPNEPSIARAVLEAAPHQAAVTIGSSMPIRDIDTYGGKGGKPLLLLGNRGANGIDGLVSAALGTAAAGKPAIALVGDVSMFHDLNSLGTAAQLGLPVTIVVINNDGGGIFHMLPQRDPSILPPSVFERYLATPHRTDFTAVAESIGLETHDVATRQELEKLIAFPVDRPRLIQLRTDREHNAGLRRVLLAGVRAIVADPSS